ncbi:hypothetical protein ALC57_15834 [Trachymyrmex cornetzi]|uniref:Uncharacterized protein n=1 Tax=Trachymyrmex cornetzi TaxID=471704 RepID=A0A151IW14_9HYME|nr:hypothetical protein ALC57_15834 [Trachymyrmex cornetzi]
MRSMVPAEYPAFIILYEKRRSGEGRGGRKREGKEENEEDARPTLARAVSAGLMAVTSRSWPDEILHLTREREREETRYQRATMEARKKEVYVANRGAGGKVQKKKSTTKWEEEAEGGRCESSALTLGFDARP